ncbi:TRAP transporter small permease [Microbaculum marinum]|uniref:TRAP transporter small permease protein n=1 Tax=Microbaculum marinum TaxID=1764581 RepID=A0AAW9RQV4_9HYPH
MTSSITHKLETWSTGFFRYVTAFMLFALMLLTLTDVLGRYFFNRPVYGGLELTEIILAGMIFSALPLVTYKGEHIVVDLFEPRAPALRRAQHVVTNLMGALVVAVLSRQLWLRAERLERAGETTIQIKIPIDIVAYTISGLLALTAIAFLIRAFCPETSPNDRGEITRGEPDT